MSSKPRVRKPQSHSRVVASGAAANLRAAMARERTQKVLARVSPWLVGGAFVALIGITLTGHLWTAVAAFLLLVSLVGVLRLSLERPEWAWAGFWVTATATLLWVLTASLLHAGVPVRYSLIVPICGAVGAVAAAMLAPRHGLSRGHQVGLAMLPILMGCGAGSWSHLTQWVVTVVGILTVFLFTGRGAARIRTLTTPKSMRSIINPPPTYRSMFAADVPDDGLTAGSDNIRKGAAAEVATARALSQLRGDWRILHSRELPGTSADVDHLLIGLGGVVVVDSKDWKGSITEETIMKFDSTLVEPDYQQFLKLGFDDDEDTSDDNFFVTISDFAHVEDEFGDPELVEIKVRSRHTLGPKGQAAFELAVREYEFEREQSAQLASQWVFNGDPSRLDSMVAPGVFEAQQVAQTLGVNDSDMHLIIAVGATTKMPHTVEMVRRLDGGNDDDLDWDVSLAQLRITIMNRNKLAKYLSQLPPLRWTTPTWWDRQFGRLRGKSATDIELAASRRYTHQLAAAADIALPPKRG